MIRPIDIRLNAAHPELPLAEAVTFTGSPSTVLIRGVPPNCGRWAITAVFVAATFPDGSTNTRAAVQSANGVWVATLPATARSGRTANGLRVMADGIDENGDAVTGYVLGVADFAVASLGVTPAPEPGETSWQMLYFDAVPGTLRKGDVAKVDGVLKLYNGTAWEAFAAPPTLDDAVTRTSANGVKSSGIWSAIWGALSALPTGFTSLYDWCVAQLAGKASTADATLTEHFSAWTFSPAAIVSHGVEHTLYMGIDPETGKGFPAFDDAEYGQIHYGENRDLADTTEQIWHGGTSETPDAEDITATRTLQGYRLGPDDSSNPNRDKPVASEAEAEALRTGKQPALSAQQLANIAAVPSKASKADATLTEKWTPTFALTDAQKEAFSQTPGASDNDYALTIVPPTSGESYKLYVGSYNAAAFRKDQSNSTNLIFTGGDARLGLQSDDIVATLSGYQLGSQDDKPLASEAEAEALRTGKQNALSAQQLANIAAVPKKANASDLRYALTTKTIDNGAVTLDDRAINAVAVSSSLASLTVNFPTATSGKARDFGLRLTVASGVTTAPELALPQGVTCENADGEAPEIGADGAATILYFTETASGVFLVKGEVLQTITQA